MEQRRHARELADHPVRLTRSGGQVLHGKVRNFSAGGLLVAVDDAPENGGPVEVFIHDSVPICTASIVRTEAEHVALAFQNIQPALALYLRSHRPSGTPTTRSGAPPEGAEALVKLCRDFVIQRFPDAIEHAKDRLVDATDVAGSNVKQARYFEAFTVLRRRHGEIQEALDERITGHGTSPDPAREGPQTNAEDASELALVDETEFDIWLIEADTAAAAEASLGKLLQTFESQLGQFLGEKIEKRNNPFGPRILAMHCADAMLERDIDPLARQFALRSFGTVILLAAGPLYEKMSALLRERGFEALEKSYTRRSDPPKPSGAPTAPTEADASGASEGSQDAGDDAAAPPSGGPGEPTPGFGHPAAGNSAVSGHAMPPGFGAAPGHAYSAQGGASTSADTFRALTTALRGLSTPASGELPAEESLAEPAETSAGVEAPVDGALLDNLLAELQTHATKSRQRRQRLDRRLREALEEIARDRRPPPRLSREQDDAAHLAEELVASMTGDLLASAQGKEWIQALEVPLLKLLLREEDIVGEKDHPARRLLNRLGQAQWRADSGSTRDRQMVDQVTEVVRALADSGPLQRDDLEDAAESVDRLVRRSLQRSEANTRRVLEAARGQERLRRARVQVEDRLATHFSGREIAAVLGELLDAGYRDLLAVETLRRKPGEDPEGGTFAVVRDLDERLSNGESAGAESDDQLLERIRERLELTGGDPGTQRELLDRLRAELSGESAVERCDGEEVVVISEPAPDPGSEQGIDEKLWLGQAKLLNVGDWMIFPGPDGRGKPLKLAWVNSSGDRYVFVDREGHKALELRHGELAGQLRQGQATFGPEGDQSLMDRSWSTIVERLQGELTHQATHDEVSGLLNRREFERRVRLRISESQLANTRHGLILVDLDQFRLINTTAGHDAGDQLLADIATAIRRECPEECEVARTGSDEFAVLLPRTEDEDVEVLANHLQQVIRDYRLEWKEQRLGVTASLGWVRVDRDSADFSSLFNQLEVACAAARETGDRVCAFLPSDDDLARQDRAQLRVRELEVALETGGLMLLGQRIVALRDDTGHSHIEVLARVRDSNGEMLSPSEYIAAAESYGRVYRLDRAVLEGALRQLSEAGTAEHSVRLAVNISGLSISRDDFVDHVTAALDRFSIAPDRLCLEITESAAMSDLNRCADVVRALREHGVRFALDDFGTGLSSFSYLKRLPVDFLKIDGSFIRGIHRDEDDRALVRSMNEVAHLLGKRTIAEYAETDEIVEVLRELGVDFVQGYATHRPAPLEDLLLGSA